jgi:hypothetical protein
MAANVYQIPSMDMLVKKMSALVILLARLAFNDYFWLNNFVYEKRISTPFARFFHICGKSAECHYHGPCG